VQTDAERVLLSVTDTGEGMTEEIKQRIFEPFFSTRKANGGTGLGLSTVYAHAKKMQATVEVSSEPKKGTRFLLAFPRLSLSPQAGKG
jgi:two-component system, cell cycle sensor histidine kinase and response regulator CckA